MHECNHDSPDACNCRHRSNFNIHHERHAGQEPPHKNNPITISLPEGSKVSSTHICDINIPGLSTVLTGYNVPGITMASLMGIRLTSKAGCKVVFDKEKCKVFYENKNILRGYKDLTTDLWTLPIINEEIAKTTPESVMLWPQSAHMMLSHQLLIQP